MGRLLDSGPMQVLPKVIEILRVVRTWPASGLGSSSPLTFARVEVNDGMACSGLSDGRMSRGRAASLLQASAGQVCLNHTVSDAWNPAARESNDHNSWT